MYRIKEWKKSSIFSWGFFSSSRSLRYLFILELDAFEWTGPTNRSLNALHTVHFFHRNEIPHLCTFDFWFTFPIITIRIEYRSCFSYSLAFFVIFFNPSHDNQLQIKLSSHWWENKYRTVVVVVHNAFPTIQQ